MCRQLRQRVWLCVRVHVCYLVTPYVCCWCRPDLLLAMTCSGDQCLTAVPCCCCWPLQAGDALQARCPTLKKALGVLQLLQCRLADIVDAWEQGALAADGFTLPEVEGLVCALFEDTDYRAECLQRIEAAADGA